MVGRARRLALVALAGLAAVAGCGYSAGFKPRAGIKSVAIPIFENRSLRRELEFPLTEAVVREVQRRTPLIVTSPEKADITLRGTIEAFDQAVLVEGDRSTVLESSAAISVGVVATERRGGELFRYSGRGARAGDGRTGPAILEIAQFSAAQGETLARPTADAFGGLAQRIVMLLEERMQSRPEAAGKE